ncbi:hypothetical protein F4820DRAFT_435222 [Hypoxylon rubiginosum]|uniref:Uncharacterized protein n=1 Tax=Hypoxylon rubiginosum TaxID=110542 RepID=A0ACB9YNN0_9PEZI|nr:hypothetical protein F4820DRAFT_435222 [Hypoxylon rubiginosum]
MDPVSAVGVAAAALQFAQLTVKVATRIAVFTILKDVSEDAEGPKAFVESLRNQLRLLNHVVRRIEEGLTSNKDKFRHDEVLELGEYVSNLNRHGEKLDKLLNKYLPSDDASTPARLLAALKSIAADIEIKSAMDRIKELHPGLQTFILTWAAFKDGAVLDTPDILGIGMEQDRQRSRFDAIYQVSRHEVRHFVDRPRVLDEIDRLLSSADTSHPRIAILQGMGGQGKTQLALRYCRNARSWNIHDCIFWVDASTRASTVQGLEKISEELNDNNQVLPDSDARIAFAKRKLSTGNLKWLLVFDNYDDPTAFDLRDYIPNSTLGNVLITSRSTDTERIGPMVHISGMTEDEATQLLFKQLDILDDGTNQVAAADIVRRLGYLPLAIDQAGAYMKAECLPLAEFLSHYEQSARDILESVPSLWEYNEPVPNEDGERTADIMAKTVFTTWNLSFTLLKPSTPTGALKVTVLSLLAFFDEHEISEELFEVYYSANATNQQLEYMSLFTDEKQQWSSRKFDSLMREFSRLSLITSHDIERKETRYALVSLHPLVRDWINLRQDLDTHRANFTTFTRILAVSLSSKFWEDLYFDYGFRISIAERRRLEKHIIPWMNVFKRHKTNLRPTIIAPESGGDSAETAAEYLTAILLSEIGQLESSYEVFKWLWESCDTSDGQMLRIKCRAGNQEVLRLWGMGQIEQAKTQSREKYQFWKAVLGVDHSADDMLHASFITLVGSLVRTVYMQDKREIIDLCKCELERVPDDVQNLQKRHNILIEMLNAAGFLRQEDLRDSTLGVILDGAAVGRGNIIWSSDNWYDIVYWCIYYSNDLDLIEQLSSAAVKWAVDKYGPDNLEVLQFLILRSTALRKMKRLAEAEAMARDCIARLRNTSRGGYLYDDVYEVLGDILHDQGRYEEAYESFNIALLQTRGQNLGNQRLRLLGSCGNAAMEFNTALADAHFTLRLQLVKMTDNWGDIVENTIDLYGTKTAAQDALDVLIEGLEVYGLAIVYCKSNTPREALRAINATIHLEDSNSVGSLPEDELVYELLMKKIFHWYGFDLLMRMAIELLKTANVNAAEQAFRLANVAFERTANMDEPGILNFIRHVLIYAQRHFEADSDGQRVQVTVERAKLLLCGKRENGMDGLEDWWDRQTTPLLKLTKTRRKYRVGLRTIQRISDKFSRAVSFNPPGSSSSRSSPSLKRSLRSVHNVAASLAGPATSGSRDRGILRDIRA